MIKDIIDQEGPIKLTLLVKSVTRALSSSGVPYLSITFQDKSGVIDAKMWQISENDELLAVPGQVLSVDGIVSNYKGHPQIKVDEIEPIDIKNVNIDKLIPSAPIPIEDIKNKVYEYVDLIEDKELKDLTLKIIKDREEDYFTYPAAIVVHHAFLGGLAYHSLNVCSDAIKIANNYSFLNRDYLISGSLLHDIGKLIELSGYIATNYTLPGNLLGHLELGSMIVFNAGKDLKTSSEKLYTLNHIIVSHHGKPEYGSIKNPMTPEAYVVHCLDDLDAKMELLSNAFEQTETGDFTKKIAWMENVSFYKDKSKD